MDVNTLMTDATLEEDGVWLPYRGGSQVRIASIGSRKFQTYKTALEKPYRRQIQMDTLDDKITTDLLCKAMARCVLLDWKGFERDGKPLRYSEKAACDLMTESRAFRNDVAAMAMEEESFKREYVETATKNSAKPSASD